MNIALLSTAYLPPIEYFSVLKKHTTILLEHQEHFVKQSYRSRCHIYGANGLLKLAIPIIHSGERTPIKEIKISYTNNWQKIHWKSIESAYRCSPYFEYYESDFSHFFLEKKYEYLITLNTELLQLLLKILKLNSIQITSTQEYYKTVNNSADYRSIISPKIPFEQNKLYEIKPYMQVFENKHGFIPNLSIIDLVFNEGPNAINLL